MERLKKIKNNNQKIMFRIIKIKVYIFSIKMFNYKQIYKLEVMNKIKIKKNKSNIQGISILVLYNYLIYIKKYW